MLSERVDDNDPFDFPTMAHVFGIKLATTKCTRRSNDGAVPIRKAVSRLDLQGASEDREGNFLHPKAGPRRDQAGGDIVRQWIGPGRSRGLYIEFLKHLHRQCAVIELQ